MNYDWVNECWLTCRKDWVNEKFSISNMTVIMSSASQTESFHLSSWNEMKQKRKIQMMTQVKMIDCCEMNRQNGCLEANSIHFIVVFVYVLFFIFYFIQNKSNEISSKLNKRLM